MYVRDSHKALYRTGSNYSNVLITRTVYEIILFLPNSLNTICQICFVIVFNRTRPHVYVHDEVQERKHVMAMGKENEEFAFPSAVRELHIY